MIFKVQQIKLLSPKKISVKFFQQYNDTSLICHLKYVCHNTLNQLSFSQMFLLNSAISDKL